MDDILKPDWIKRRKSQAALADAKTEAVKQREKAALLEIQAGSPEFWRQLLVESAANTNSLPDVGARGRTSTFGNRRGGEQRCRIEVVQSGRILGMTYTDLFYTPGDCMIRSLTLEGESNNFTFCVLPKNKGIAVLSDDGFTPLGAKELAELLVEQMVDRVREMAP